MLQDQRDLLQWYDRNKRTLPWRQDADPYKIWISEIMLQQTTVAAVVPFFERFMALFPNVQALAQAPIGLVLEAWAGLGYYSRARNLHKTAQEIAKAGFPRTHTELLNLPGLGPYTSRAIASIAFEEKVGVIDGNVIRVLSRRFGLTQEWWKPKHRADFQDRADKLAQVAKPSQLNQALMELGATVCTPQSPACLLCPWSSRCVARQTQQVETLPLKKPRREREIWIWKPWLVEDRGKVALVQNNYAPFLKNQLIWPGQVSRKQKAPTRYSYKHSVTHHDIFVVIETTTKSNLKKQNLDVKWINKNELRRWVPASLVYKALSVVPCS